MSRVAGYNGSVGTTSGSRCPAAKMTDNLTIRLARPEDADRVAVLLYSAYRHRQVTYPLPEAGEHQWLERLEHFFCREGNRFSYQCIQVAEQHAEVVGLVLSFGGREEARLNTAIGWPLECEAQGDEWYVDALAVFTSRGRQGIGTRLLQAAEQRARHHGYSKIALHVAQENAPALSLYHRLRYVVTKQALLSSLPSAGGRGFAVFAPSLLSPHVCFSGRNAGKISTSCCPPV